VTNWIARRVVQHDGCGTWTSREDRAVALDLEQKNRRTPAGVTSKRFWSAWRRASFPRRRRADLDGQRGGERLLSLTGHGRRSAASVFSRGDLAPYSRSSATSHHAGSTVREITLARESEVHSGGRGHRSVRRGRSSRRRGARARRCHAAHPAQRVPRGAMSRAGLRTRSRITHPNPAQRRAVATHFGSSPRRARSWPSAPTRLSRRSRRSRIW
jgi:hypothetical protein